MGIPVKFVTLDYDRGERITLRNAGDLSLNCSRDELLCQCPRHRGAAVRDDPDPVLVASLQALRYDLGRRIVVTSGVRCPAHNAEVGGAPGSMHVQAKAADIIVAGMESEELANRAERIEAFKMGGIGLYDGGRIHADVRPDGPARWDERSQA